MVLAGAQAGRLRIELPAWQRLGALRRQLARHLGLSQHCASATADPAAVGPDGTDLVLLMHRGRVLDAGGCDGKALHHLGVGTGDRIDVLVLE